MISPVYAGFLSLFFVMLLPLAVEGQQQLKHEVEDCEVEVRGCGDDTNGVLAEGIPFEGGCGVKDIL